MENQGKDKSPKALGSVEEGKLKPLSQNLTTMQPVAEEVKKPLSTEEMFAEFMKQQAENTKTINDLRSQLETAQKDKGSSAQDIAAALREVVSIPSNETQGNNVFDENDWDEKGVDFFSYRVMTVLASDRRNGYETMPPNGPIIFEYKVGITKKEGKETNIINICGFTSHSKKEIEWIKNHTEFKAGIISEKFNKDITHNQVMKATRAAKHVNHISVLPINVVIQRCKENSIPLLEDLEMMRGMLADHLVNKEIDEETNRAQKIFQENSRESLLESVNPIA